MEGCNDGVVGGAVGHGDFRGEPGDGVADANCSGLEDPDAPASVRFGSRTNIPAVQAMWRPRGTLAWFGVG